MAASQDFRSNTRKKKEQKEQEQREANGAGKMDQPCADGEPGASEIVGIRKRWRRAEPGFQVIS